MFSALGGAFFCGNATHTIKAIGAYQSAFEIHNNFSLRQRRIGKANRRCFRKCKRIAASYRIEKYWGRMGGLTNAVAAGSPTQRMLAESQMMGRPV